MKVFTGDFIDEIKEGFKLKSLYNNVSSSPEYYIALLNEKKLKLRALFFLLLLLEGSLLPE